MANRNWRSSNYQTFNQILTPMSYYPQPVTYQAERKNYGGRGGYREENYKRERKELPTNRRERFSPTKRRSPYQRSHESHGSFRKDSKKSHGHYEVKVPRLTFDIKELSTSSLKFRYPKMYIPSDFFHTHLNVQEAFPLYRSMKFGNHCEFQVLSKEVDVEDHQVEGVADPDDACLKYSAKVMLMTTPPLPELYKSSCHLPTSANSRFGVYKNIQFLMGSKGKNELAAIGGAWSPSLDGANPDKDPEVLIKTAIRTCMAQTGIDLSHCKKWYKFLDVHYYRSSNQKTRAEPEPEKVEDNKSMEVEEEQEVVEVVTIFVPDVWSCVPTEEQWTELRGKFEKKLQSLLNPKSAEEPAQEKIEDKEEEKTEEHVEDVKEEKDDEKIVEEPSAASLDLNQMKVTELRAELVARGLDTKGLKMQLIQRLQEALESEKKVVATVHDDAMDTNLETSAVADVVTPLVESIKVIEPVVAANQVSEKEQKRLEKLYKLNEVPSLLVYGGNGRPECKLVTLESLLEQRTDDQKEHVFEVSLFAEQFCEMVQRDAAFVIYKALIELPDLTSKDASLANTIAVGEPEAKRSRLSDHLNNSATVDPRRSKMITDLQLLFAFFVFDCDNGGYLRDHDLENILHCIGLNLSRSQIKRLLAKLPMRKGSVVYRDVVDRDVVEGSVEDVACLKTDVTSLERLIELSHGNKAFFDELDAQTVTASRDPSLAILDRVSGAETKKLSHEIQLSLLHDELNKIKTCHAGAGEVETHLRDNIKKLQDKLTAEKEALTKLTDVTTVYGTLLRSARDHISISVKAINEQFEHEKQMSDDRKAKEQEDAEKVRIAEADKAMAVDESIVINVGDVVPEGKELEAKN